MDNRNLKTMNSKAASLKKRAEALVFDKSPGHETISKMSPKEIKKLVHDLSVYQIELEMQNDELRRIHAELEKSKNKYTHLYDFSPVGYFTISDQGIMEEVNLTGADMLGVEHQTLVGDRFAKFIFKHDQDAYYMLQKRLLDTGMPCSSELRLTKRDGREFYIHLECAIVTDNITHHRQIRAAAIDITDKKTAEAALRQNEAKYRSMMENLHDGVYICSSDYRIEYMNPKMIRRIGYDATGDVCHRAIYKTDKECPHCGFDQVLKGKFAEYEIADPIDNRYYKISSSPIPHADGSVSKFTISRDITLQKRMETKLRQAHKMKAIGTLAGGIAHDFNNILYMIIGNSELALGKVPETNPVQSHLEKIKTSALRAADIVKQLLDFSRKFDPELKSVDVVQVIKDAGRFLRSMIPSSIEIRTHVPAEKITIFADPGQIQQVLVNIGINSYQAMKENGGLLEISLECETLSEGIDDGYYHLVPGAYARITVKDSGPGIRPELIENIFDPYFTGWDSGQGAGLGLAVVHGIVKNHNGGITVKNPPGGGAVFILRFPAIAGQPVIGKKAQAEFPPGHESILFVDDEELITDLSREMLELLGYRVETRKYPEDAVSLFRSNPHSFDLVITDMTMPRMTGVQLSAALKAVRFDIPVIICTGHSPLMNEKMAENRGFAAYIKKPIVMSDLAKTIRKVLDKQ